MVLIPGRSRLPLLVLLLSLVSPEQLRAITLDVASDALRIAGATPEGRVLIFGVVNEPQGYHVRFIRRHTILDADRDGVASWSVVGGSPSRAVWVAVDLTSGDFHATSPATSPLRTMQLRPDSLRADAVGQIKKIALQRNGVDVLLVRPSNGSAWASVFRQGTPSDDDGADDGTLLAAIERARAITPNTDSADRIRNGDLIIAIDVRSLEIGALKVGPW